MMGWIIDGGMYIHTGQISRKTKTKESPTDSRHHPQLGRKKKRNKGLEGKRKHKERSQSGRNSRRIDWFDFSFFDLYTCLLACCPLKEGIEKHLISYYTGLYNLIFSFLFLSFLSFSFFCRLFSICSFSISILASSPSPSPSSFFQASRHSLYSFSFLINVLRSSSPQTCCFTLWGHPSYSAS